MECEDKPIIYGGKQRLETLEGVNLPLIKKGGLSHLTIQYPTQEDLDKYPTTELASDLPWNPEDDNDVQAPRNVQEYKTTRDDGEIEELRPCLGWRPMEVIKNP